MRIGPIELSAPFCQAGLAGYSDRAMRLVARRRGCPYAVTEALLDTIMLNGGQGLKNSIDINDEDHPTAGQVIGSEPETVAPAAAILHNAGYDVIDLNFACPVKKIKNKARGGHMLRDQPRGLGILRAVRDRLPNATLTVSLRRTFSDNESHDTLYGLLDEAWNLGYAAARVHARSVEAKYNGRADWAALAEIKRQYPTRTILGSGDVFTAEDAVRMKRETGVDIVWIARGAIGNPWIFRDAAKLFFVGATPASPASVNTADRATQASPLQQTLQPPTVAEQRQALREHWDESLKIHGEQTTGRRMRKQGIKYARFHPQADWVKKEFVNVASIPDWARVLDKWYAADGPGVWPAPDAADEVNANPADAGCGIE
ncbi:MAG: tRNA-dihydrouridine synthase family protein [Tepidisphaeraceae bacterium]